MELKDAIDAEVAGREGCELGREHSKEGRRSFTRSVSQLLGTVDIYNRYSMTFQLHFNSCPIDFNGFQRISKGGTSFPQVTRNPHAPSVAWDHSAGVLRLQLVAARAMPSLEGCKSGDKMLLS